MAELSPKQIKSRVRSMEATRQITRAMEMVAASKLRRAQTQALATRPCFETLYATMQNIVAADREVSSPYLVGRPGGRPLCLVIAGDRGLAGGYNGNLFRLVQAQFAGRNAGVLPLGKKAAEFFKVPNARYNETARVTMGDCFTLAKKLCEDFRRGEINEVHIGYTAFVSVLTQVPKVLKALPMDMERPKGPGQVTLYEPDGETVFDAIVPEYLGIVLYGALCESRASEQAARRMAMDAATKNADRMMEQMRLKFNRARQAGITQEITEIIAGAKRS